MAIATAAAEEESALSDELLYLSQTSYGLGYPFGQLGSAVSYPNSMSIPILTDGVRVAFKLSFLPLSPLALPCNCATVMPIPTVDVIDPHSDLGMLA
ncbi:hypothetical protein DUI87_16055 [Hirundo rustica rustica]|uniref:Uncharacterized protein n=1 Tax=Hirundo rustica rustica TaxID=333673 RepID=A0A3M0KHH7_HIRRU|nr:hypothetical protein DUI87_16055 [Hirundo rustica rustica]